MMKKKKPLLPAQRRFLHYIMVCDPSVIDGHTEDRIRRALNHGEYLTDGPSCDLFNRLRNNYMEDFAMFVNSLREYEAYKL